MKGMLIAPARSGHGRLKLSPKASAKPMSGTKMAITRMKSSSVRASKESLDEDGHEGGGLAYVLPVADVVAADEFAQPERQEVVRHVPDDHDREESSGRDRTYVQEKSSPSQGAEPYANEIQTDAWNDVDVVCAGESVDESSEIDRDEKKRHENGAEQKPDPDPLPAVHILSPYQSALGLLYHVRVYERCHSRLSTNGRVLNS